MTVGKVTKTRSESTIRARIHTTELSVKFRSEFRTGNFFLKKKKKIRCFVFILIKRLNPRVQSFVETNYIFREIESESKGVS